MQYNVTCMKLQSVIIRRHMLSYVVYMMIVINVYVQ